MNEDEKREREREKEKNADLHIPRSRRMSPVIMRQRESKMDKLLLMLA